MSRKWKPLLKMKAFQNKRQDTFHSLDMYSKQNKNSSNLDDSVNNFKKILIFILHKFNEKNCKYKLKCLL